MTIEIGPDGQLGSPTDLAFDNEGNLYVCDTKYHHVQKFTLINNRPCSEMSLGSSDFLISIEFFFVFIEGTTTPKNRAISSYQNRYNWMIMAIISS